MTQKTMVGARAKVKVDGVVVGLYDSCQYAANLGNEAIHILGRYSATEISINSYEAIQVQCSGFRIVDQGVHLLPKAPKLQDLLNLERVSLEIEDRQTGENIMNVNECVAVNWGEGQQAKATSKFSITYMGLVLSDESGDQNETDNAADLP
jgi:hypothetical protein